MTTNLLLRSQQNELHREIQRLRVPASDFKWQEELSQFSREVNVAVLVHVPTKFDLVFDKEKNASSWFAVASPHDEMIGRGYLGRAGDWQSMFEIAKGWLAVVAKEHFEPNLWHLNDVERALGAPAFDEMDNRKFSEIELSRIESALVELKAFLVATSGHTGEQNSFITLRLTHLEDASKRLGRKDWITLAMGTLTNIIVGVALAPDAARELLRNAGALLGWVASGALSLP